MMGTSSSETVGNLSVAEVASAGVHKGVHAFSDSMSRMDDQDMVSDLQEISVSSEEHQREEDSQQIKQHQQQHQPQIKKSKTNEKPFTNGHVHSKQLNGFPVHDDSKTDDAHCAYCYRDICKQQDDYCVCEKCKKRSFCSPKCQNLDRTSSHHNVYCGQSGEEGIDYEIIPSGPKQGMIALRDFAKDETILVERPITTQLNATTLKEDQPKHLIPQESLFAQYQTLLPMDGTLQEKAQRNAFSISDDGSTGGLFVTLSRLNHHCLGNCDHVYLANRNVKLLVATRPIAKGQAICYSYTGHSTLRAEERRERLLAQYQISCTCSVCTSPASESSWKDGSTPRVTAADLDRLVDLEEAMVTYGDQGQIGHALQTGVELLELKKRYSLGSWSESTTYFDMFQMAVTKQHFMRQAKLCIEEAHSLALRFTGDPDCDPVQQLKQYMDAPESHLYYLALEPQEKKKSQKEASSPQE